MEQDTPPATGDPLIEAPPYDTARFVCECGEAQWDEPADDQWERGHQFECDHCGRQYQLQLDRVQDATNTYPHCAQCDSVLHAHSGNKDTGPFYACRECGYNVPQTDDPEQLRRWILAHAVYMRVCERRVEEDADYRHVDPSAYAGVWMFLDDAFRDELEFDAVDSLPPTDDWCDAQVDRLLDAGIIAKGE